MTKPAPRKEVVRDVVATDGVAWRLREVRDWNGAGKQVKALLAERAGGFRKVWSYPGDWAELSDAQLATLINDPAPGEPPARAESSGLNAGADAAQSPGTAGRKLGVDTAAGIR